MTGDVALLLAESGAPRLALLAIFIAPVVGVKAVVPTVGIAAMEAAVLLGACSFLWRASRV
jgi:hypothetical protein